ncbi:BFD-like [2Fe-2S] binding domain-containing protein [Propionispora hippei DSM 15287]|uniref:BFD-like [2Fe-2S] binding domain-containing protein n=1 Tax=Propionispora hippei DSM 15287 TaxID=1123003 RepID=A0A1M6HY31_9FIRM|nr:BFD-like [2Fe-2S] binding domain-containing protein [Propionispora hippei DSM 15287]
MVISIENELNQEILDKLTKVCLCKGISRATMKKAIAGGADTVEKVRKATGAGSGSCGGRRCTPKIEELLAATTSSEQ